MKVFVINISSLIVYNYLSYFKFGLYKTVFTEPSHVFLVPTKS